MNTYVAAFIFLASPARQSQAIRQTTQRLGSRVTDLATRQETQANLERNAADTKYGVLSPNLQGPAILSTGWITRQQQHSYIQPQAIERLGRFDRKVATQNPL